jgi:hypothetical protein
MTSTSVPLEFWFNKNSGLALPISNLYFNHPVKSILFVLNNNNYNSKKYKEEQDINFICDQFKKICIPITYEEWFIKLSQNDKNIINNIDKEDKEWLYNLMNIDIDE